MAKPVASDQPQFRVWIVPVLVVLVLGLGWCVYAYVPGLLWSLTPDLSINLEPEAPPAIVTLPRERFAVNPQSYGAGKLEEKPREPIPMAQPRERVVIPPTPPVATPAPTPAPAPMPVQHAQTDMLPEFFRLWREDRANMDRKMEQQTQQQMQAYQRSQTPQGQAGQQQPKPKQWAAMGKPTRTGDAAKEDPTLSEERKAEQARAKAAEELIKNAKWAVPIEPAKTLYSTQFIPVVLREAVNSDLPGSLVMEVTAPVFGFHGKGDEIIPKGAKIVGAVEGQAQYGQVLVPIKVQQIQDVDTGAVIGVSAAMGNDWVKDFKVNNHYGKLILAAGLSAVLNIGVQTAAGTPGRGQYYQDPVQAAASDATRDIQSSAKGIIDRQLKVPPTITRKEGTFATIKLTENYMFHYGPVVLK